MTKSYIYQVIGRDTYKVSRIDESKPKGHKERYKEYFINLKNGDSMCSCKGFYYKKKACKHLLFLMEQLRDKGGILQHEKEGDYDRLIESLK